MASILSEKDRLLLFYLSLDARASVTSLAKKVRLSKQLVSYRLARLERLGVIVGYHAIVDIYRLGRTHYRVFAKLQNCTKEQERELFASLAAEPNVSWLVDFDGDFDVGFVIWAQTTEELERAYDRVMQRHGSRFLTRYFSISTRIEYRQFGFLTGKAGSASLLFGGHCELLALDDLDRALLDDLSLDARATLVTLAQKHGLSPKVVRDRISRLRERGVIVGYNLAIDHHLLGYTHRKVLLRLNETDPATLSRVAEHLRCESAVLYLVKTIGEYDYEFELMTRTEQEFHDLLDRFRTSFAAQVRSYDSVILHAEPKSGQMAGF